MFNAKTVFILGAGASCHYGYPTGEDLVKRVERKADSLWRYLSEALKNPRAPTIRPEYVKRNHPAMPPDGMTGLKQQICDAMEDCKELTLRLRYVDPLVIDYFIGQNRQLEDIAKLCIAWELLECEAADDEVYSAASQTKNNNNWCRFIIHKLVSGCADGADILKNNVNFITFNYDTSLEKHLHSALLSLSKFEKFVDPFFENDRVLHIYGKIEDPDGQQLRGADWKLAEITELKNAHEKPDSLIWDRGKILLDRAFEASKGIEIIAPDKAEVNTQIERSRRLILEAECVYILGYGFDQVNNKVLDLPKSLRAGNNWKYVMFTNYGNRGSVNKNASRMFFNNDASLLLANSNQLITNFRPFICEKSINNIYQALAFDFDSPEERPHL